MSRQPLTFWRNFRINPDPCQMLVRLELRRAFLDCSSVLDVGCGKNSPLQFYAIKQLVGLEGYGPDAEAAQQMNTHDQIIVGDVRNLPEYFHRNQFDACVALDVIEHLSKPDGLKMLSDMEMLSTKKVIIFTPNGFLPQTHKEHSDLQEHLSGWRAAEMRAQGYKVIGLLGPKSLRGEYHGLKRKPKFFWAFIALLCHLFWTRNHPEKAAAILCIKGTSMPT